jgi:hypothetical protein
LLGAQVGYRFDNGWMIRLEGANLLNSKGNQITYAYGSFLKSDPLYAPCYLGVGPLPPAAVCANGVMGRVVHPVEPPSLRLTIAGSF